jgi:hypothetical protein
LLARLAVAVIVAAVAILVVAPSSRLFLLSNATASCDDGVEIWTSANLHCKRFFGKSLLQVAITFPDRDDDNGNWADTIMVWLDAITANGSSSTSHFDVFETGKSSGRFEFFLIHKDADAVPPGNIDPINSDGVECENDSGNGVSMGAPIIEFGADAPNADAIDIDVELFEPAGFEIMVSDVTVTAEYEEIDFSGNDQLSAQIIT